MTSGDSREELLLVGRIARAHGIRGQVIVNPETDFAEDRFRVGQVLLVGPEDRAVPRRVTEARIQQGRPVVAFEGIASMNDAMELAGADVWLPASSIPPLPSGTFYRHDLVGCEVRAAGKGVGKVVAVHGPIDRCHLVVEGQRGEILIPLVDHICVNVDPANGVIDVNPPAGLLEANER